MSKICMNCEFMRQAKTCSVCGNNEQNDKDLKSYIYWNFSCELFKKSKYKESMPDEEKIKLGYIKLEDGKWGFPKI